MLVTVLVTIVAIGFQSRHALEHGLHVLGLQGHARCLVFGMVEIQ